MGIVGQRPCPTPSLVCQTLRVYKAKARLGLVAEEPSEPIIPSAVELQSPLIFMNVSRYEWHLGMHVQGLDEEAC